MLFQKEKRNIILIFQKELIYKAPVLFHFEVSFLAEIVRQFIYQIVPSAYWTESSLLPL